MNRPSIVLIVIDALRGDCTPGADDSPHLHSLGLKRPDMPALAALTRGAATFTQTYACASYTSACHASLFTGLLPPEHGVRAFRTTSLSSEARTLAQILLDAGYSTCAMSDQPIMFQSRQLLRGFQTFVTSEDDALAWWDSYQNGPRFLFFHLWDIHQPYGMPVGRSYHSTYPDIIAHWQERLRSRHIPTPEVDDSAREDIDRYRVNLMQVAWHDVMGYKSALEDYLDGVVTFDSGRLRAFAECLRGHGVGDDAMLVVTADHGEGREPPPLRRSGHGTSLTDDQIHIPFYMRVPGLPAAPAIADQVSQADIAPTILDTLELLDQRTPPSHACSGRSLAPLLRGETMAGRPAYAEIWATLSGRREEDSDTGTALHEALPRYRILRYPERKYWLTGKHMAVTDAMLDLPAADLLTVLFHDLLGRPARPSERETWLPVIQAIPATDPARRRALVRRFETTDELRYLPQFAIHDLRHDALEQKPIDPRLKPADWAEYQPQLETMLEIDRCARPGDPLVLHQDDEQIILRRLRDLGYVE